jgi:hypothetical protein
MKNSAVPGVSLEVEAAQLYLLAMTEEKAVVLHALIKG